jgi:hypothetical protein
MNRMASRQWRNTGDPDEQGGGQKAEGVGAAGGSVEAAAHGTAAKGRMSTVISSSIDDGGSPGGGVGGVGGGGGGNVGGLSGGAGASTEGGGTPEEEGGIEDLIKDVHRKQKQMGSLQEGQMGDLGLKFSGASRRGSILAAIYRRIPYDIGRGKEKEARERERERMALLALIGLSRPV